MVVASYCRCTLVYSDKSEESGRTADSVEGRPCMHPAPSGDWCSSPGEEVIRVGMDGANPRDFVP